jgi:hypothetical protein
VTKREARPLWHGSLRHAAEVDSRLPAEHYPAGWLTCSNRPRPASRVTCRPILENGCGVDGDPPWQSNRARQYPRN